MTPPSPDPEAIAAAARSLGDLASPDTPLGARTTYRVGGNAAILVEANSLADLRLVAEAVKVSNLPCLTVGKGSNLLVADRGFPGIAVILGDAFSELSVGAEGVVEAGAAVALPVLARRTVAAGRSGLEWAVGVPGSVGGAVRMNAGGHGSDIAASLIDATVLDLTSTSTSTLDNTDLDFGYRSSAVTDELIVLSARFRTDEGAVEVGERLLGEIVTWRREHQPGGQNAGSVFVNPSGTSAGAEIEAAGLKGLRLGSAHVSTKHANFIQADEGGSADDVHELMDTVAAAVRRERGIGLHTEIRRIGFDDESLKEEIR